MTMPTQRPLTPQSVNGTARMMLPWYTFLAGYLGVTYLFDPLLDNRAANAESLAPARELMPITYWGVVWLLVAAVLAVALLTHRRDTAAVTLYAFGIFLGLWAGTYALALLTTPGASFAAAGITVTLGLSVFGVARSLIGE